MKRTAIAMVALCLSSASFAQSDLKQPAAVLAMKFGCQFDGWERGQNFITFYGHCNRTPHYLKLTGVGVDTVDSISVKHLDEPNPEAPPMHLTLKKDRSLLRRVSVKQSWPPYR